MRPRALPALVLLLFLSPHLAAAQIIESAGSRALGMGGAFVAVAADSSATWWNPGALAAGPFVDAALTRSVTDVSSRIPARHEAVSSDTITAPMLGFSYYRFRITDIAAAGSTATGPAGREDTRAGVRVRSLSASQLGVTVVQSLLSGIHVGATLKYVRGRVLTAADDATLGVPDLVDRGEALTGGSSEGTFDVDVGVLATHRALRVGVVARNLAEPSFAGAGGTPLVLPRQVRAGAAFDGDAINWVPLTLSIDADVKRYPTMSGDRQVVAIGAEQWVWGKRLAIRGGGRVNTAGAQERAATAGGSVMVRSGLFVDLHVVRGGSRDERGWGAAARVSF
jgi:hypothetical protein